MLEKRLTVAILTDEERFKISLEIDNAIEKQDENFFRDLLNWLPKTFTLQQLHDLILEKYGHVSGDQAEKIVDYYWFKGKARKEGGSYLKC